MKNLSLSLVVCYLVCNLKASFIKKPSYKVLLACYTEILRNQF